MGQNISTDRAASQPGANQLEQELSDVFLKDFKTRHLRPLENFLDDVRTPGIADWLSVANKIPKELTIQIEQLKSKYISGNDGNLFLQTLKSTNPDVTVEDFIETADDLGRRDIARLLNPIPSNTLLYKIDESLKQELAELLSITGSEAVRSWRYFAEEYGLHEADVNARVRKEGSPTRELFKLVVSRNTNNTAYDLREVLVAVGRSDAAKYVEDIVPKILEQKEMSKSTDQSRFVGRKTEMEEIHQVLTADEGEAVVLCGVPGVGKSGLAREYVKQYLSYYTKSYWIDGESEYKVRAKLVDIICSLLPETDVRKMVSIDTKMIMDRLYTILTKEDSLLVFDNICKPREFSTWVESRCSALGKIPKVLITTNISAGFNPKENFHKLKVKPLTKSDTGELLRMTLPGENFDDVEIEKTHLALGGSPLSINVAIANVENNYTALTESHEGFQEKHDISQDIALEIAITEVLLNPDMITKDLLFVTSLMDGLNLEEELLVEYVRDDQLIISSFNDLTNRALLRRKDSGCYEMHSRIKKILQAKIFDNNDQCRYVNTLIDIIKSYQEKQCNRNHTTFGNVWLHHVIHIIDHHGNDVEIMKVLENLKQDIIDALTNKGDNSTLMTYLRLFLQSETTREESFDVIWRTSNNIGRCFYKSGDYRAGINHLDELLVQCKEKYGDEHNNTLITTNVLGMCMQYSGDLSGARRLYQTVYDVRLRLHGDENEWTLTSLNNLAACIDDQGDLNGARPLYEKVFDIHKRVNGVDHPHTLLSMNNLAHCMDDQGDLEAARSLYKQTYEIQQRVMGEHHPSTLLTMMNLGVCMMDQGEVEGARKLLQKAFDGHKRILGNSHPKTLLAKRHLDNCP